MSDVEWEGLGRVEAQKISGISKLPSTFVIALNRITTNWDTGEVEKINSRYDFPVRFESLYAFMGFNVQTLY